MYIPDEMINTPKKIDFDTKIYEKNIDYGEFDNVVRFSDFVRNSGELTYEQAEEKFKDNLPKIAGYRYVLEDYPKEERFNIIDSETGKVVLDIYEAIVLEKEKVRERIPEDKNKDNDNRDADGFEGEFPVDMKDLGPNEAAIAIGYGEEGSERYTGKFFDRDEDPTLNYYDSFDETDCDIDF